MYGSCFKEYLNTIIINLREQGPNSSTIKLVGMRGIMGGDKIEVRYL